MRVGRAQALPAEVRLAVQARHVQAAFDEVARDGHLAVRARLGGELDAGGDCLVVAQRPPAVVVVAGQRVVRLRTLRVFCAALVAPSRVAPAPDLCLRQVLALNSVDLAA